MRLGPKVSIPKRVEESSHEEFVEVRHPRRLSDVVAGKHSAATNATSRADSPSRLKESAYTHKPRSRRRSRPESPRAAPTRTQFSGIRLGTSCRSGNKVDEAQYLYSLSERPKLRRLLENQNNKGTVQKSHWRSSISCRKVLVTADHKVLNEGGASRDSHRYAVVVQDLATQWIQSYPCKTKSPQNTEKSLFKFLEPSQGTESYIHRHLDQIRESMWCFIMESPHFNSHRSETMASLLEPFDE